MSASTIRRSRLTFLLLTIGAAFIYFFGGSLNLSEHFQKDGDGATFSRANLAKLVGGFSSKTKVDEIYGLIHLVTHDEEENQHVFANTANFNPSIPVDMSVYAMNDVRLDWSKEMERLNEVYPVIVFSKTYCQFSRRVKQLLSAYDLYPPPKIIEVDIRDDSAQIKALLTRLTQRGTFPNVIVKGKSIGGSDDVHALHASDSLKSIFTEAGVEIQSEHI